MRFFSLLILLAVVILAGVFNLGGQYDDSMTRAIIGFGFLIFTGFIAGEFVSLIHLPKISGYLLAGMICGPHVIGIIDIDVVHKLRTVDELALALIAFTAGGELRLEKIKRMGKMLANITVLQTICVFVLIFLFVLALSFVYPPLKELPLLSTVAIAMFVGLITSANSPATAVAVIVETKSKGYMTDQVMGVTILKDVLIIVLSALILAVGGWLLDPDKPIKFALVGIVFGELALSVLVGTAIAALIAVYMRLIKRDTVLFVVALTLLILFVSEKLHLHFLVVCITAGFVVENFTPIGKRLINAIERTSMTIYVVFFAIAGASIDFGLLRSSWLIALAIVLVRVIALAGSTWAVSSRDKFCPKLVGKSWMAYLSQAGISLGLASLIVKTVPQIGSLFYTVIVATIALNQLIGPVTLKFFLTKSEETAECRFAKEITHIPVADRE